jgi:hypothetical protein
VGFVRFVGFVGFVTRVGLRAVARSVDVGRFGSVGRIGGAGRVAGGAEPGASSVTSVVRVGRSALNHSSAGTKTAARTAAAEAMAT